MSFVRDHGLRRAAKRHRCWFCDQRIEVGEQYGYRAGATGGDFWIMHFHPECAAQADATWDSDDWEDAEPGMYPRPMTAFDPCI